MQVARAQVELDPGAVGQPVAACNTDRYTRTDRRGSNRGIHKNTDSPNNKGIHNTGNPNNTDNPAQSKVEARPPVAATIKVTAASVIPAASEATTDGASAANRSANSPASTTTCANALGVRRRKQKW